MTPRAKRSTRLSMGLRRTISGARMSVVPVRFPPEQKVGVQGIVRPKSMSPKLSLLVDHHVSGAEVAVDPLVVVQVLHGVAELIEVADAIAVELRCASRRGS